MLLKIFSFLTKLFAISSSLAAEDAACCGRKKIPVGGQAVIEGVLMRGPEHWGLVVREPSGAMWRKAWLGATWLKRGPWKLPIVRGFANMVEMMRVGTRALSLSAERALGEEEKFSWFELLITIGVAIALVVGLFIALPVWIGDVAAEALGLGDVGRHVAEGISRGAVFVVYIAGASILKDIRRVFAYHGAEHKTINAYESGAEVSIDSARASSRIHRRCGTSFLVIVVFVSIILFSAIGGGSLAFRAGIRVLMLPIVIGVSYEFIKAASASRTWGRVLIIPALTLQFLTTREPDDSMLEVAISSLDAALDPEAVISAIDDRSSFEQIAHETAA